jgi:RNA 2',3'-cyclic 3'-phosphodiesterase
VSDERARLFVALELPDEAREALIAWSAPIVGRAAALRPVGAEALHVTLCFLGWRSVSEIAPIAAACATLDTSAPPLLSFGDAAWLPPRRARVLAVELVDSGGALGSLQASLSSALEAGGWYQPEGRPFLGHVTVARVRKDGRIGRRDLGSAPELSFGASSVTLFRSRLGPKGAHYERLSEVRLSG